MLISFARLSYLIRIRFNVRQSAKVTNKPKYFKNLIKKKKRNLCPRSLVKIVNQTIQTWKL